VPLDFCPYLRQILADFENLYWHTLQTICDKTVVKEIDLTRNALLHYLVKYKFLKMAPTEAEQGQTE